MITRGTNSRLSTSNDGTQWVPLIPLESIEKPDWIVKQLALEMRQAAQTKRQWEVLYGATWAGWESTKDPYAFNTVILEQAFTGKCIECFIIKLDDIKSIEPIEHLISIIRIERHIGVHVLRLLHVGRLRLRLFAHHARQKRFVL